MSKRRNSRRRGVLFAAVVLAVTVVSFGGVASSAPGQSLTKVTVNTLPIANGLPLTLGINKGFFQAQGIEVERKVFQSGNDIVLALANGDGDVGYIGYTPAMIGLTQGIPIVVAAASETEGATEADNWQNVVVRGSSSIRTPADLAGKTVALNALKGVAEVIVKGALEKRGVDPDSVRYTVMPFPTMPSRARQRARRRGPHTGAVHVADPRGGRSGSSWRRDRSSRRSSRTGATAHGRTGCGRTRVS